MHMAPYDLASSLGPVAYALVFGAIGFGFGAALEMGGFGDTRKLAGQFYFKDMTVLKVMFTGIAVAAVLVALATSFGLLDLSRVFVNPTYLWPGIVGGLIMGVGFVIGGFCPGTSLVAASTLKIDGMVFLLGALLGVWLFGETVGSFQPFWLSSYMGRFTLPDWLGLPVGVTVLLVVVMALFLFWAGDLAQQHFGEGKPWNEVRRVPGTGTLAFAGALVAASLVLVGHGQPTPEAKFALLGPEVRRSVEERGIFVDPAEVVALRKDIGVKVVILDLRDETEFNLFHIGESRRVSLSELESPARLKTLLDQPPSTVTFLVGNGEAAAFTAWKHLIAQGVPNLYVIDGGMNRWLER
jgi:rhodanese-related sulfurtransferase